jgi:hypothetical protein
MTEEQKTHPQAAQPDYPIYAEIMKACEAYTGMQGASIPNYFLNPYPQRLYVLNHLLRWHQFREEGDIGKFLKLSSQLNQLKGRQPGTIDKYVEAMAQWLNDELGSLKPHPITTPRKKVVISLMVWGEEFIAKTVDQLIQSWLADGGIEYLSSRMCVIINIQTTLSSHAMIAQSTVMRKLAEMGINFVYTLIPDALTDSLSKDTIYWLVGAAATLGINCAKVNGAAYHHACPDAVYSAGYFRELLRLAETHNNIFQIAMRTDECPMLESLQAYRADGVISIPTPDLVALSLNNLHITETPSLLNNRPSVEAVPVTHKLYWEGQDTIHLQSPHVNVAWLAGSSIRELPRRFYHSIDSELDLIARGTDFYIPRAEDDLYVAELSHQSNYPNNDGFLHIRDYGDLFWKVISVRDLLKFFSPGMVVKVNRALRPGVATFSERQIAYEKEQLRYTILSVDPYKGKKMARERLHDQQLYG